MLFSTLFYFFFPINYIVTHFSKSGFFYVLITFAFKTLFTHSLNYKQNLLTQILYIKRQCGLSPLLLSLLFAFLAPSPPLHRVGVVLPSVPKNRQFSSFTNHTVDSALHRIRIHQSPSNMARRLILLLLEGQPAILAKDRELISRMAPSSAMPGLVTPTTCPFKLVFAAEWRAWATANRD